MSINVKGRTFSVEHIKAIQQMLQARNTNRYNTLETAQFLINDAFDLLEEILNKFSIKSCIIDDTISEQVLNQLLESGKCITRVQVVNPSDFYNIEEKKPCGNLSITA